MQQRIWAVLVKTNDNLDQLNIYLPLMLILMENCEVVLIIYRSGDCESSCLKTNPHSFTSHSNPRQMMIMLLLK